ncbi:MAG: type II secretion system F family protein [Lachnospiraceae bacterium]|nr:type II secretion system F family protein [Lachnospiraceae bacterium]
MEKENRNKKKKNHNTPFDKNKTASCEKNDVAWIFIKGIGLLCLFSILFYNSLWPIIIGSIALIPFYKRERDKLLKKKHEELAVHFKESLFVVLSALKAGYSVENAFVEAQKEMQFRFSEKNVMVQELILINRQVKNNIPIEQLLENFAHKTHSEDIKDFADIFKLAKRSGGDMGEIMEHTISVITRRMEMRETIKLLSAAKKYEQSIMNLVPVGIIFYIRLTNPGYFDSLYHNLFGICVMTAALLVYASAYLLSEKILEIA